MADHLAFYLFDGRVPTVVSELQVALSGKPYQLYLSGCGWIQPVLKDSLPRIDTGGHLNFLQDHKYDFKHLASDGIFSLAKLLPTYRLAKMEEWGLGRDNGYLHLFWVLNADACHQAAKTVDRLLDLVFVEMHKPGSLFCEYSDSRSPTSREQLKTAVDPTTFTAGESDSTAYLLHALNSLYLLCRSVKENEFILVDSSEFVPVVPL